MNISVRVTSEPKDAEIWVNGKYSGFLTDRTIPLEIDPTQELQAFEVTVRKEGYEEPNRKLIEVTSRISNVYPYDKEYSIAVFDSDGTVDYAGSKDEVVFLDFDLEKSSDSTESGPSTVDVTISVQGAPEVSVLYNDFLFNISSDDPLILRSQKAGETVTIQTDRNIDGYRFQLYRIQQENKERRIEYTNEIDVKLVEDTDIRLFFNVYDPARITSISQDFDVIVDTATETEKPFQFIVRTENADEIEVNPSFGQSKRLPVGDDGRVVVEYEFFRDVETFGLKDITVRAIKNDKVGETASIRINFIELTESRLIELNYPEQVEISPSLDFSAEFEISWEAVNADKVNISTELELTSDIATPVYWTDLPLSGSLRLDYDDLKDRGAPFGNIEFTVTPWKGNDPGTRERFEIEFIPPPALTRDTAIDKFADGFNSAIGNLFDRRYGIEQENQRYLRNIMNFGNDDQVLITTWAPDDVTFEASDMNIRKAGSIVLKLYDSLPETFEVNDQLWISLEVTPPLIENIILSEEGVDVCKRLRGPNFSIDVDSVSKEEYGYESFDDLTISGSSVSTDIIDFFLSGSIDRKELGIDYRVYDDFIHFSSALERLNNFKYKLQLIESYDKKLTEIDNATGSLDSTATQNERESIVNKRLDVINNFDGYETHLWENSGSTAWPMTGSKNYHTTSSQAETWFTSQSDVAEIYDNSNPDSLVNNIPGYLRLNSQNDDYILFTSMVGHHFDILWAYVKGMKEIHNITHDSKTGIPDELVYHVLSSFGWEAKHGRESVLLSEYALGKTPTGSVASSITGKDYTNELWRRILNNLPYILKHKGTKRAIEALITCYGIPATILSIREYGGPSVEGTQEAQYIFEDFAYALSVDSGSHVEVDWSDTDQNRKPDSIEFMLSTPTVGDYTVVQGESSQWSVKLQEISASLNTGRVSLEVSGSGSQVYTLTSSVLPIFDGDFYRVLVNRTSGGGVVSTFDLFVKKGNGLQFTHQDSASMDVSSSTWEDATSVRIGSGSGGHYVGRIDEFRLWETPLNETAFNNHVRFSEAINGNHTSSSTEDLLMRLSFYSASNLGAFSEAPIKNVAPVSTYQQYVTASGFVSKTSHPYNYYDFNRTNAANIPNVGISRFSNSKIRLEDQELISDLNSKTRATKKAFDRAPVDSNRLGIFFSPTDVVNHDILRTFGGEDLSDYIGDPEDAYSDEYKDLQSLNEYYWSRYPSGSGNDIWEYMRYVRSFDKSLFEHMEQLIPARAKHTTGLLVEPHLLERNKIQLKKPSKEELLYETEIDYQESQEISLTVEDYDTELFITESILLSGEDNVYNSFLTASDVYNFTGEDLLHSGLISQEENTVVSGTVDDYEATVAANVRTGSVQVSLDDIKFAIYGMELDQEVLNDPNLGRPQTRFGIYARSGSTDLLYVKDGKISSKRVKLELITETRTYKQYVLYPGSGQEGPYFLQDVVEETERLNILPISASFTPGSTPLDGYSYPHHRRYTSDLTKGLRNSYYEGSKQTVDTTIDGGLPVETFVTNPNVLKVNKVGRSTDEPILEVD